MRYDRRVRRRSAATATAMVTILAVLPCCTKTERPGNGPSATPASEGAVASSSVAPPVVPPPAPSASPTVDAAPASPAPVPSGVGTLVVQRVSADCAVGGWARTSEKVHYLGTDLIVLVQGEG